MTDLDRLSLVDHIERTEQSEIHGLAPASRP
jgi:hypothetical protein